MKDVILTVTENEPITASGSVFRMKLAGDVSAVTRPGQFVELKTDGCYLRRPISVCDVEDGLLTLIYKVVGKGTEILSAASPGDSFDVLTGLGNGYDLDKAGEMPLLLGGGVGVPPLIYLAKELARRGAKPSAVIGLSRYCKVLGSMSHQLCNSFVIYLHLYFLCSEQKAMLRDTQRERFYHCLSR